MFQISILKSRTLWDWLIFLINPLISAILVLGNLKSKNSLFIIGAFYLLFGMAFMPVDEAADSYRYAEKFSIFSINPEQNLANSIDIYIEDPEEGENVKDLYLYFMFYISCKIAGDNIHFLFFLFSIVFAFFSLSCLWYITSNENYKNCWPMYALLFLFLFSNDIYNINGVRFWTASWIAVYMMYGYFIRRNSFYLLWLIVLPLVHQSYLLFDVFFLISVVCRLRINILIKLYIISFFLGEIGLHFTETVKDSLPNSLQRMVFSYTESDEAQKKISGEIASADPLYAQILNSLPKYFELIMLYLVSIAHNKNKDKRMLLFTLTYFICVNICAMIPSMGRFYQVGFPLIIYLWVDNFKTMTKYNKFLYFIPLVYAYPLLYWYRRIKEVTEGPIYFANPFYIIKYYLVK